MDLCIILPLAVVVCLPAWWLFLAISGYRDESFIPRDKSVPMGELGRLANSLITILHFWH